MGANLSYPTVDLSGKVVIVTGGNGGIGYETAKGIASMGAHTIIACRSEEKATAAIEQMKGEINKPVTLEYMPLDLASFDSTRNFTNSFKEKQLPLHILINNAGLVGPAQIERTRDGYELAYQVNHLSHYLLTIELLPVMLDTAATCGDCRIVIVSGGIYRIASFEPDNMNGERSYSRHNFYAKTKLYNIMHAYALQRRLKNVGITVSVLHPGVINSRLLDNSVDETTISFKISKFFAQRLLKDTAAGSVTSINCAVNPQLNSQECIYYSVNEVSQTSASSRDESKQEQLWKMSSEAVKHLMSSELYDKYGLPLEEEGRPLEETTPATEETTPATEETTPAIEETTPATNEEITPVTEETTPATEETTPATNEEITPVTKETTPATEETTPATNEEITPVTEETTPVTKETTPATKETTPATNEEITPVTEETTPATNEEVERA